MTIYARADLAHTLIPESAGGCGERHFRPVVNGAPAKLWALTCENGCENYLRHDPLWSVTTTEVPETYDETKAREQAEKSGKLDRERQLAEALIQLGKLGDLPQALGGMLAHLMGTTPPAALEGQMECPAGHVNAAGLKFCGECGQPMSAPVAAAAISAPQEPAQEPEQSPAPQKRRLRDARLEELQALAVAHKIDPVGTRADLIVKLSAAGVTSNDLSRLPVAA